MAARERTAVVAEPSAAERARLSGLLRELGYAAPLEAEDGLAALRLVEDRLPDALLISATLRPGDGVWLAQAVMKRPFPVRPGIVLLHLPGLLLPQRARLSAAGAAVIDRPARRAELEAALAETASALWGTRAAPILKRRWATPGWTRGFRAASPPRFIPLWAAATA